MNSCNIATDYELYSLYSFIPFFVTPFSQMSMNEDGPPPLEPIPQRYPECRKKNHNEKKRKIEQGDRTAKKM